MIPEGNPDLLGCGIYTYICLCVPAVGQLGLWLLVLSMVSLPCVCFSSNTSLAASFIACVIFSTLCVAGVTVFICSCLMVSEMFCVHLSICVHVSLWLSVSPPHPFFANSSATSSPAFCACPFIHCHAILCLSFTLLVSCFCRFDAPLFFGITIVYTSQFVCVILAEGPCQSSLYCSNLNG